MTRPLPKSVPILAGAAIVLVTMAALPALAQQAPPAGTGAPVIQLGTARAPDPAVARLQTRIDDLEAQVREATDLVERMQNELRQTRAEIERQGRTIDDLLRQQATTPPPAEPAPEPPPAPQVSLPDQPDEAFAAAFARLSAGDYAGAEGAFTQFIARFPSSPRTADARFWLGESQFVQEAWADAATTYLQIVQNHATATRAPDAHVRLAASLRRLGQTAQACTTLASFRQRFPTAAPDLRQRAEAERRAAACPA
jgi:tol-pal system protein YbgF